MVRSDIKRYDKVAAVVSRVAIKIIRDLIYSIECTKQTSSSFFAVRNKENPGTRRSSFHVCTPDYRETDARRTERTNGTTNSYIFTRDRQSCVGDRDEYKFYRGNLYRHAPRGVMESYLD